MWAAVLAWLKDNQIGDLTGLAGLALSLFGFAATLVGVRRSRAAAERAEAAARAAREDIRLFETVIDFTAAIAMLEDIKRGHRQEQWGLLLDRYAAIRKVLVTLNAANITLSADQRVAVQSALANIATIEREVEEGLKDSDYPTGRASQRDRLARHRQAASRSGRNQNGARRGAIMNFERQKLLVERLQDRTLAGELPWQEGVRPESFQVSFPGTSVQIASTSDGRFDEYRVSIIDAIGRVTDSLDSAQLDRDGLHASGTWKIIMRELFTAARRTALRADEALENILAAIG